MTSGVTVAGIEGRHERGSEGEVGFLQVGIRVDKLVRQLSLLLIQTEQTLGSKSRDEEQRERPRRNLGYATVKAATIGVYRAIETTSIGAPVRSE